MPKAEGSGRTKRRGREMSEGQRGIILVANIKFIMEEQIKILGKNVTDRVPEFTGEVTGIVFYTDRATECFS